MRLTLVRGCEGVQNVLMFMVNYDKWSGCVVMRPGPEKYPVGTDSHRDPNMPLLALIEFDA